MARFSDLKWLDRNWEFAIRVVAVFATFYFGQKLAEQAAMAVDPFYSPAIVGLFSGFVLLRLLLSVEKMSGEPSENFGSGSGYVANQWLKTPTFNLSVFLACSVFLVVWLYPKAWDRAVNEHVTDDAWFVGFSFSLLFLWSIELKREFTLKRASQ